MIRPESAPVYEQIDLKLGIKSSLPSVKPTLALLFLMWREMGRPSELEYSITHENGIVLRPDIRERLYKKACEVSATLSPEQFSDTVNNNLMLKSQLEALLVAFELIWKVAVIRFTDGRQNSSERTGGSRFPKKVWFTLNMDLLDTVCGDDADYDKVLFSWLGIDVPFDEQKEKTLIRFLTAISEGAYYKLIDNEKDIVFNLESVYNAVLSHDEAVDVSGDKEAKGSLRILKSALAEDLFTFLKAQNSLVTAPDLDALRQYAERVAVFHQLNPRVYLTENSPDVEHHDVDNEEAFKEWFAHQKRDNGELYSANTQGQYLSAMRVAATEFADIIAPHSKFFNIETVEELELIHSALKQDARYDQFNRNRGSGELPACLSLYRVFLEESAPGTRYSTGYVSTFPRNRILFGAPGTGKSFTLNREKDVLLADGGEYERVTFHPDYSYANFVGTYKPVMVSDTPILPSDTETNYVLSVLTDKSKTAQEKYDLLFDVFKDEGVTRLPILLGLYTDELFKTRKHDGNAASGDNSVERNHGRAIRKYVNLITGNEGSNEIAYEYVPGPFMRMYVKALKNARTGNPKPHLLIIEEINRANVAAVFGDVFQLLDRGDDEVSEYPIQASEDIKKHLAKELGGNPENYAEIRIPDNMFIWATMNSADQGVFPMDTAFKRRWDFTYLGIDDSEAGIVGKKVVLGQGTYRRVVEWNALRKAINNELLDYKVNEDKLMGPYFISKKFLPEGEMIDPAVFTRIFKNKVIMYLFDDAAKQKRPTLFAGCDEKAKNQYSKICEEFEKKGVHIFCEAISSQFIDTVPEDDGK